MARLNGRPQFRVQAIVGAVTTSTGNGSLLQYKRDLYLAFINV